MKIWELKSFRKDYAALPARTQKKVDRVLKLRTTESNNPGLRIHKVANQPDICEARVDLHYRITFQMEGENIVLRRVGTHEVYRNP
jgi:hypothetical protein